MLVGMEVEVRPLSAVQRRTRSAILAATASVLAVDRTATLPDIAKAAGVGRTTLHRYFADRERLVHAATLAAIRCVDDVITDTGLAHGPAIEAMRRLINALISIGDQVVFLFGDPAALRNIEVADQPNDAYILELIERGQAEGTFDSALSATWIEHSMFALVLWACQDVRTGELARHAAADTVVRTLERGVCTPAG